MNEKRPSPNAGSPGDGPAPAARHPRPAIRASVAADLSYLAMETDRRIGREARDEDAGRIDRSGKRHGVGRQPRKPQWTIVRFIADQEDETMSGALRGLERQADQR